MSCSHRMAARKLRGRYREILSRKLRVRDREILCACLRVGRDCVCACWCEVRWGGVGWGVRV